ncbi:MAG TPA: L,D-transpeptidase family protein [Holophagaceae bacterium]|nr:L,D-transpeptidase family protein [Holophagaceae bacterium]
MPKVRIFKAARRLELWEGEVCLGTWPCRLGRAPEGTKEREGDGRTPEGRFYVCTRNEASRFHRFLGLSYPTPGDAARGLATGLLRTAEAGAIGEAHAQGVRPPWDTALGGQIGIHAAPTGETMPEGDWTEGCIAVDLDVMARLWEACPLGAGVRILP